MFKPFLRLERRQVAGLVFGGIILFCVVFAYLGEPWFNPVDDLNGTLGLCLAFLPAMLVPRRWLSAAFLLLSLYFVVMGAFWGNLARQGQVHGGFLFPFACIFAAVVFVLCARIAKRSSLPPSNGIQAPKKPLV